MSKLGREIAADEKAREATNRGVEAWFCQNCGEKAYQDDLSAAHKTWQQWQCQCCSSWNDHSGA